MLDIWSNNISGLAKTRFGLTLTIFSPSMTEDKITKCLTVFKSAETRGLRSSD